MSVLGTYLSLLAGPTLPLPLPPHIGQRVRAVSVTESDTDVTVFTITLDAGRAGQLTAFDTPVLTDSPLRAGARVGVVLTMSGLPHVVVDGILTEIRLTPGSSGQGAELSLTGQDVSLLLDRTEKSEPHIGLEDSLRVRNIAGPYATQGIVPLVIPPPTTDPPLPIERTPTQQATDWRYLGELAHHHGYVCYLTPNPVPGTSTLFWGPPVRTGPPQRALTVGMGPTSNVQGLHIRTDVLRPERVEGSVHDARLGKTLPVRTVASLRPPLAAKPVWAEHAATLRTRQYRASGETAAMANARALATLEASADCVVAEGTLDGGAYGRVLRPRGLVGLRGAGWSHDGLWYVKRVEHTVGRGAYSVGFTLTREGTGSTVPVVPVF